MIRDSLEVCTDQDLKLIFWKMRSIFQILGNASIEVELVSAGMLPGSLGEAARNEDEEGEVWYTISIVRGLQVKAVTEILLHELAHVVQWEVGDENEADHGPEWGIIYASLHCLWYDIT